MLSQDLDQEVDIPHGQAKRFIFAQLLVWRVSGDEFPQLGEGTVDTLLPPPLPGVCEDLSGHVQVPEMREKRDFGGQDLQSHVLPRTCNARSS